MATSSNLLNRDEENPPISSQTNTDASEIHNRAIRNPQVPRLENVEGDFVARSHEFIRWAIGTVILFVPIKYIVNAVKKAAKPGDVPDFFKLPKIDLLSTWLDVNFAYPFCLLLAAYGALHIAATSFSSPTTARNLERYSVGCGYVSLLLVEYYAGPWVCLYSALVAVMIIGVLNLPNLFRFFESRFGNLYQRCKSYFGNEEETMVA